MIASIQAAPVRPQSTSAPAQQPPSDDQPQPQGDAVTLGEKVQTVVGHVVGTALGVGLGAGAAVFNACEGAARGLVHGARLKDEKGLVYAGAYAANLAATGAVAGAVHGTAALAGGALNVIGGAVYEHFQDEATKADVKGTAEQWTDSVISTVEKGDPAQAGTALRIANGALGEVVGAAAGTVVGAGIGFTTGHEIGQMLVNRVGNKLRGVENKPN